MVNEKKWFVIRTRPRAEKRVAARLQVPGAEVYLPLYRCLKLWHDRKKWVEEALFKSYVFIHCTENQRPEVFEVPGVLSYLFSGGKAAVVTEKEIAGIKIFCTFEDVSISANNFVSGDEVEIINGELAGYRGRLQETAKGRKLRIYIPSLSCFACITVDKEEVRKIAVTGKEML